MINFKYDSIMKRHDVKVPFSLVAGDYEEKGLRTIASIYEDDKIILHGNIHIKLLRQILLHWDEYEHQRTREFNELMEGDK